MTTKSDTGIK